MRRTQWKYFLKKILKSLISINPTVIIIIIEEMTSWRFVTGEQTHSVVQE